MVAMVALAWNPVQMSPEVKKGYQCHHKNEPKLNIQIIFPIQLIELDWFFLFQENWNVKWYK